MANKIYISDIGTIILIDMGENISLAIGITLDVIAPKSNNKIWIPDIEGTNFLRYVIDEGDLDQVGIYKINPKLTLGDWTGHGDTVEFEVFNKGE